MAALHRRKIPVYLISGGFRGLVGPVALELNIPLQNIYANRLKFFLNGGFDSHVFLLNATASHINGAKTYLFITFIIEKHIIRLWCARVVQTLLYA